MKRIWFIIILLGLLASACAPQGSGMPATGGSTPTPESTPTTEPTTGQPTPEPTQGHIPVDLPPAQLAAIKALADELGIGTEEIQILSVEDVNWPDGCLGVVRMGVMCTQQIVPGFSIILQANGEKYEYHTNADGSVVVKSPLTNAEAPQKAAQQVLARLLGIDPASINVASSHPIEWGDACLGVAQPGVVCAQMVTPGFIILLEANGKQYELHTNEDGSLVVDGAVALSWHREGGIAGFCDDLVIYDAGEVRAAECTSNGKTWSGSLRDLASAEELTKYNAWLAKYATVTVNMDDGGTADAMKVTLNLNGSGHAQPTGAEKQEMVAWAQALYAKLNAK